MTNNEIENKCDDEFSNLTDNWDGELEDTFEEGWNSCLTFILELLKSNG